MQSFPEACEATEKDKERLAELLKKDPEASYILEVLSIYWGGPSGEKGAAG